MYTSRDEMIRANASMKSYIGPAVIVLLLYMLFYVPGLVANIAWFNECRRNESIAGHGLPGMGCLAIELGLGLCVIAGAVVILLVRSAQGY